MATDPPSSPVVLDVSGREATLVRPPDGDERVVLTLASGQRVAVPADTIHLVDGVYRYVLGFDALEASDKSVVIPLVEEQIEVSKQIRETGRVRLIKHVETEDVTVDEPLLQDNIEIERVAIGRYVEESPGARREGDTTIIPIIEEVLVVEKRLLLKEELHITKRQTEVREPQHISLRKERVEVERLAATDDAPDGSAER